MGRPRTQNSFKTAKQQILLSWTIHKFRRMQLQESDHWHLDLKPPICCSKLFWRLSPPRGPHFRCSAWMNFSSPSGVWKLCTASTLHPPELLHWFLFTVERTLARTDPSEVIRKSVLSGSRPICYCMTPNFCKVLCPCPIPKRLTVVCWAHAPPLLTNISNCK